MMKGRIKRLVKEKGFGFIASEGSEYFFHRSSVLNVNWDELEEGDEVSFDVEKSQKGPRASNVSK
jgi:CspA family cold shock protein